MFWETEKNKDFFSGRFGNKEGCSIFAVPNVGDVAQSVEQRTENPCVGGSIPSITTKKSRFGGIFCFLRILFPHYFRLMERFVHLLKSKIHRATVTEAQLEYFGSITIDENLMDAAGIHAFEKVLVTNMREGHRLETYVLKGERGSGVICLNGPSAHFFHKGDEILIMAFESVSPELAKDHVPKVIFPELGNKTWITKAHGTH